MKPIGRSRPSPAIIVVVAALIAALGGTAVAEEAKTSAKPVTKKRVKKIATKRINKLAPGLSVANAEAVDGVSQEELTIGRSAQGSCNPSATTFLDCVGVTLSLPRAGRVHLNADYFADIGSGGFGRCRLEVDDATTGIPHSTAASHGTQGQGYASRTAVTRVLTAGSHRFELSCSEDAFPVFFDFALISAVMIGSG